MKILVREIQSRSILTPQNAGSLAGHYDYSLNPYAGCAFACSYCYVPKFPNADDRQASDWGNWVNIKMNAPELIRRDRLKVFASRIFFSSATDPYQYLELKYRLTRRCLEELSRYQPAKLTMHTRSHLILEDISLLKGFGNRLKVGVSFGTDNDDVRAEFEPKAPSLKRRLQLMDKLKAEGINVFASVAPLLPCDPQTLVGLLKERVDSIWIDEMRWPEVNTRPELLVKYGEFFAADKYSKVRLWIKDQFLA